MKRCPFCHSRIYQDDDYCCNCGSRLSKTSKNNSTITFEHIPSFDLNNTTKTSKKIKKQYEFSNKMTNKMKFFNILILGVIAVFIVFKFINANDYIDDIISNSIKDDVQTGEMAFDYQEAIEFYPKEKEMLTQSYHLQDKVNELLKNTLDMESVDSYFMYDGKVLSLSNQFEKLNKNLNSYISLAKDENYAVLGISYIVDELNVDILTEEDLSLMKEYCLYVSGVDFDTSLYEELLSGIDKTNSQSSSFVYDDNISFEFSIEPADTNGYLVNYYIDVYDFEINLEDY